MQKIRKSVVMLVVVAMLVSLCPMLSLAIEGNPSTLHEAEAQALHDLGLFNGISTTSFDPALSLKLDREQGITILLRLLGKEGKASELTNEEVDSALSNYTDKEEVESWAKKNVAYSVKNGLVIGTTLTTLSALAPLEGNAFATMILRNLGYTVSPSEYIAACDTLESKGATGAGAFISNTSLTRDDAVVMAIHALATKYAVDGKSICKKLIEQGLFTTEKAREVLARVGITISDLTPEFEGKVTSEKVSLPADKASSSLITFELRNSSNEIINTTGKIKFESSLGTFDKDEVDMIGGKATAMLTSQYLSSDQEAIITATIKVVAIPKYLNTIGTYKLKFIANVVPEGGASLITAKSLSADRILVTFDRPVDYKNYVIAETGRLDITKCEIMVRKASTSSTTGAECKVRGLMPGSIPTDIQILLDVEDSYLNAIQDNSQTWVRFTDKVKDAPIVSEKSFNFMETSRPSVVKVESLSFYAFKVIYSEPVYYGEAEYPEYQKSLQGFNLVKYSARNPINYKIDAISLNDNRWGNDSHITVGRFDPLKQTDKRNEVIVSLGRVHGNRVALPIGKHSLKVIDVGDWAEPNDISNNDVSPEQDVDFEVTNSGVGPVASIKVLSPEQYLLSFDVDVPQTSDRVAQNVILQRFSPITNNWVTVANGYDNPNTSLQDTHQQHMLVTKARNIEGKIIVNDTMYEDVDRIGNQFILECSSDWSKVLNGSSEKYYYSSKYRIKLNGDAVESCLTGAGNAEANLELGEPMKSPDLISPSCTTINPTYRREEGTSYDITMSEPVKFDKILNKEGTTVSLDQESGVGVPIPVVKFISKENTSKIVNADITRTSTDDMHFTVVMQNRQKLEPGDWTMQISQMSDDIGNTLNSSPKDITVRDVNGFRVLWFFADTDTDKFVEDTDPSDDDNSFDYIFVKYSNPIAVSGSYTEAFQISNYQINGRALPENSTIDNSIEGFDNDRLDSNANTICDSVTIKLPQGYLQSLRGPTSVGGVNNISVTVKSNIKNAKGVSLRNETDIPHQSPYRDDSVAGNQVMSPFFGHLGFLRGGLLGVKAHRSFTLFTTPTDGSILTIGSQRIGFSSTGGYINGTVFTINTIAVNTPQAICDFIESNLPVGDVTTIANANNKLDLEATDAGYAGNSILVSLQ
jgi:hypothetical protein